MILKNFLKSRNGWFDTKRKNQELYRKQTKSQFFNRNTIYIK